MKGKNYLLPIEPKKGDDIGEWTNDEIEHGMGFAVARIRAALEDKRPENCVILLDCCRSVSSRGARGKC